MKGDLQSFLGQVNHARYDGRAVGHYESYFLRGNHPERPLAFWIRYTLFSPQARPQDAIGELWAVFFNGETNNHIAVKKEVPLNECIFNTSDFEVRIGDAHLMSRSLSGAVQTDVNKISWDLSYHGDASPLLLLPFMLYRTKLPAAKSLVALPMTQYKGKLVVNGESIDVTDWRGSENHNWGSRHTDLYAWGQVAGFDSHPGSFLELATAKLKIGPFWMPALTPIVLRHNGEEHALNGLIPLVKSSGSFDYFNWSFKSETTMVEIEGTIKAPREAFVGLTYFNPPGGIKYCLNSKIASCVVRFREKGRNAWETLEARNRAAFEILTDDPSHGIPMVV